MAEPNEDPREETEERPAAGGQFFWEIIIFLTGLFIGFYWHWYAQNAPSTSEVHLIIGLFVIIICMARFVYLLWRGQQK